MSNDLLNLDRYVEAQESSYDDALREIRNGVKESCWMWYIWPQIVGLGCSGMDQKYSIKCLDEAQKYRDHSVLWPRLIEISRAVVEIVGSNAEEVMWYPDDLKLRSSATLFLQTQGDENDVFQQILDRYYNGELDERTLQILAELGE